MKASSVLLPVLSALAAAALPGLSRSASSSTASRAVTCDGTFKDISAQDFVDAMNPGWNLGNTLDAVEDEGDWNNPPVTEVTFDDVKASGFKGIRLPVTWAYHFTAESPDWTVDPTWLQRVSDVVDMVIERGLYTIVNVHHDSWIWADVSASGANYTLIEEKFYKLWYQIGTELACKSELVAFEPINEPPGTTQEHATELNKLNNLFLKAINDAGGFNARRVVTLPGLGEDSIKTSQWFEAPSSDYTNPWAIQYHYYSPYDFVFGAWGKTIWGADADKAALEADIANIRGNFTDIPLIIGEWDASPANTETAARWKYFDFFVATAEKYDTPTILWDNGADHLDRSTHIWRDPSAIEILINEAAGTPNALADSTEDASATSQSTSAYLFHKVGTEVTDQTLPFILNGNTLDSVALGSSDLASGADYSVSGSDVTFTSSFLTDQGLTTDGEPGVKGTLSLSFSPGADLTVQLVQWDVPSIGEGTSSPATNADLAIPITWKGLPVVAAVKAVTASGKYLVDDWTQYLGPLQQARATFSNHYNWDASHIILTAGAGSAVLAAGENTVFTFEFYPRVPGNSLNYTLTV